MTEEETTINKSIEKTANEISPFILPLCSLGVNFIEESYRRENYIRTYGVEIYKEAVKLSQTSVHDFKTCLEICFERKTREEFYKLAEEIDKQPLININELLLRKKSKEDKLPRKLRNGWK